MIKLSIRKQAVSNETALDLILRSPSVQIELNRYKGIEKTINLAEILFNAYLKDVKTVSDHTGEEMPAIVKDIIANKDKVKQVLREKFNSN